MGSMQHQVFQIQKETTPGTALITAMRIYDGLQMTPGTGNQGGQSYSASGSRGTDTRIKGDDFGQHTIELTPDFNALLPVLASVLGVPVSTQPDAVNAPTAYQHVFTLLRRGVRNPVSFTAQWGAGSDAIQFVYFLFNTLGLGVQRSQLTFDTSAFSRDGDPTITLATSGVTTVPSVPIDPTRYDVFSDDSWDDLGTTQLLDCHEGAIAIGDTWGRSSPINSAIVSFAQALENEDVEYSGNMLLAALLLLTACSYAAHLLARILRGFFMTLCRSLPTSPTTVFILLLLPSLPCPLLFLPAALHHVHLLCRCRGRPAV